MKLLKSENIKKFIPFAELIAMGFSFINTLIIMNSLSIESYASYSYIITIVMWAVVFMDLGIANMIFTKGLMNQIDELDIFLTARTINSFIVIFLLGLFFFIRKPELVIVGSIYGLVIFINSTSTLLKNLMRSQEYSKVDLFIIFSETLLRTIFLLIVFIFMPKGSINLTIIVFILLLAGVFAIIFNYKKVFLKIPIKINITNWDYIYKSLKTSFAEAKYFIIYFFLFALLGRIEIVFLEKYSTTYQLGIFASARNLLDFIQLFFAAIITSRYREFNQNPKKMFSIILGFNIFVIIFTQILSHWGFVFLFPKDYENGYKILNILIFSIIPNTIYTYLITLFNFNKLTHYNIFLLLFPILIKIFLYNILKPSQMEFYTLSYMIIEYITLLSFIILFLINFNNIHKNYAN